MRAMQEGMLEIGWINRDVYVFQFRIDVEGFGAGFAGAVARPFDSTEGHVRLTAIRPGIDDDDSGLHLLGELHRAMDIAGVDAGGETVKRVVRQRQRFGKIFDPIEAGDGAEQFAIGNFVAGIDIVNKRGREVEAGAMVGVGEAASPGQDGHAPFPRPFDGGQHVLQLFFVNHRAEVVVIPHPDFHFVHALDQHLAKLFVNRIEDEDATAGGASLTGIAERGKQNPFGAVVEIGVVANDERILAAKFERYFCQSLSGSHSDLFAHERRAGETDHADGWILDEWCARLFAIALHDVEQAGRQSGLVGDLTEDPGCGRCVFGGFEDGGVPADEGGENFPGHIGDGGVGRDDEAGHPDRLANRHHIAIRRAAGRGAPVEALALAGIEKAKLNRAAGFAESVFVRFAGFEMDDAGHVGLMLLYGDDDLVQEEATLDGGHVGPGGLGARGSVHGDLDVSGARAGDTAESFTVVRVEFVESFAGAGGRLFTVNPIGDSLRERIVHYFIVHHSLTTPSSLHQ